MPAQYDIALQRNEDWGRTFRLSSSGLPIDLTGMTVAMQVREKLTQTLVSAADIEISDAANGEITANLIGSEGSPLAAYGNPVQTTSLKYDLRITDVDGFQMVPLGGTLVLSPGQTVAS